MIPGTDPGSAGGNLSLLLAAVLGVIGKHLWTKHISTEGKAYDALVEQQASRIETLEGRLGRLEERLDTEVKARQDAEQQVSYLTGRVRLLEIELKRHNIEVPT